MTYTLDDCCGQNPHDYRCGYARTLDTVYDCDGCHEPIVVGENYYELDEEHYHTDCLSEEVAAEIIKEYFPVSEMVEVLKPFGLARRGVAKIEEVTR